MALPFNLGKGSKVLRVMNAVAAGTSVQTSTTFDMQGFDSVLILGAFGALTATQATKMKAQGGLLANGSDAADLAATGTPVGANMADTDSNTDLVLDLVRPLFRFITVVVNRGTANAVINGVWAILYNVQKTPAPIPSTLSSVETVINTVVSPAAGTAN
jgi:hypothetical protein